MNKHRIAYLDILRIISFFAVVMIHVSAQHLASVTEGSYPWTVFISVGDFFSFAVPVFVMISGTLFLDKDITIETIIKKYLFKIAVAFCFWSFLYTILFVRNEGILTMGGYFIRGYSHMWFMYMISGLYLATPLLRKIVADKQLLRYFVILGLLFDMLLPDMLAILGKINGKISDYLSYPITNISVNLCTGYVLFYVLGYYLGKNRIPSGAFYILVILGTLCFIVPPIMFFGGYKIGDEYLGSFMNALSIVKFSKAMTVYVVIKRLAEKKPYGNKILGLLGECCFGTYLIHQMIINMLNKIFGLNTLTFTPVISILLIALITFIVSFVIILPIRKIAFVRKYIT